MYKKLCASCSTEKTVNLFHKNKSRKDGLNGFCKECMKKQCASSYQKKKDKYLENGLKWRNENRERHKRLSREWHKKNPEKSKKNSKTWSSANKGKRNSITAKRYADKTKATPSWLSKVQILEIQDIYWLASDLKAVSGEEYHVDHIIPLRGKNICGLHVPWNLQILPADLNLSKGANYEP